MEVDSSRLRRLAAAVREEAVRVRGAARRLDAVRDVVWHSPAGALFRDRVGERVHALRVTATRLDSAADHLDVQYGPFAGPARRYLVTGPEGMGRRFESLRFVFSQPDADFSPADARAGSRAAHYAVRLVLVGFRYDDRVVLTIPIAADMLDLAHADIPDGIRIEAVSGGR